MGIDVLLTLRDEIRIEAGTAELGAGDLVAAYDCFCSAHGIMMQAEDEELLSAYWRRCVATVAQRGCATIDYRPRMGAKFFAHLSPGRITLTCYKEESPGGALVVFFEALRDYFRAGLRR